jgi:hypothetical protein
VSLIASTLNGNAVLETVWQALYNGCATPCPYSDSDNSMAAKIFHPLLVMIASATDQELAKQVLYLKEDNKIVRARIPGQIHKDQKD